MPTQISCSGNKLIHLSGKIHLPKDNRKDAQLIQAYTILYRFATEMILLFYLMHKFCEQVLGMALNNFLKIFHNVWITHTWVIMCTPQVL